MKCKGAEIVVNCLMEQGADTVFGYPGVSILEVYDALYKNRKSIRHILSAHEQGAAHAADGYARSTGRVGVCLATSGPGATNLVTGIAAAFMDSSPVVFISCNVDDELLGRDAFQEVDIVGISMPITKSSCLVDSAEGIAPALREAFAIAASGRPGPVLVDITHNATVQSAEYEFINKSEHISRGLLTRLQSRGGAWLKKTEPDSGAVIKALDMLAAAERPLILSGGGVVRSGAGKALEKFAEEHNIPLVTTLMGVGGARPKNGLFFSMAGSYGCPAANFALQNCDVLLAVGVRFSDRLTGKTDSFAPSAKIIHIDIDRSEIDKNVSAAHHIIGDAAEVADKLNLIDRKFTSSEKWLDQIRDSRKISEKASLPERLIQTVYRLCPDAVIATDVGQHQIWTCRNFDFSYSGQLITSGGYGAMGFGLGAAIGAKAGKREKTVIHITGDGSFGMNLTELATAVREKLPVITVVFNNSALGLVRQNQTLNCGGRYSQTSLAENPDYIKLAGAFGIPGERAENTEQLERALKKLLKSAKGGVIDCPIDRDELIRPMLDKGRLVY